MLIGYFSNDNNTECGLDEAGRGCLVGSVFAGAVILPKDYKNSLLNDSKQLTDKKRRELRTIIEQDAISFAVAEVSAEEIDEINILQASILAMNRALEKLDVRPDFLLVDGNRFHTDTHIPYKTIIHGDALYLSIAAASILAKTYRDDYMIDLAEKYPQYDLASNKGYPTEKHRQAIERYGITPLHRKTFRLLKEQTLF